MNHKTSAHVRYENRKQETKQMSEYKYRTVNGKRVPEHRAVVEELLGINLRDDQVVHHINGDKTDNRPENLQILDWREHSRLHASTMPQTPEKQRKVSAARKGKSNPDARALTDEQVEVIVRALHEGATVTRLAKENGVSDHVIRNIRDGKTYQDVLAKMPQELFPLPGAKKRKTSANANRKCNVAEVTMIRLEILQGYSIASIAKRRGLAQETVRKIRDRESYQDIPWPEKQAEYPIIHDMKRLADIMLQGPMPEKEDGFAYTEGDIQALTGEKIDPILIRKYGIYPTYHARIVYLMMQRALDGDHTMLFALFSLSSYDNLVPQLIDETQAAEKES